jgi:hypothetical protein
MKLEDLLGLCVFVVSAALVVGQMIRSSRRLHRARPGLSEPSTQPRRIVMPPPAERAPVRADAPPKRAAPTKRRPPPTFEARLFGNRRLSSGARLVIASEILSKPKALRRRAPF